MKTYAVTYPIGVVQCQVIAEDEKYTFVVPPVQSGQRVAVISRDGRPAFTQAKDVATVASLRLSQEGYDKVKAALAA